MGLLMFLYCVLCYVQIKSDNLFLCILGVSSKVFFPSTVVIFEFLCNICAQVDCIPTGPRVWHTASTQYNRDGTQVYIFGGSKCNLFQGGDNIVSLSHLLILQYGKYSPSCPLKVKTIEYSYKI